MDRSSYADGLTAGLQIGMTLGVFVLSFVLYMMNHGGLWGIVALINAVVTVLFGYNAYRNLRRPAADANPSEAG